MTLVAILRTIPATVRLHEPTFQRVRASQPAFAPYATAFALLDALSRDSHTPLDDRQHLVRALVTLHQTVRHPLWQALLLHAFRPMLRSLRAFYRGPAEEGDQRVRYIWGRIEHFLRHAERGRRIRSAADRRTQARAEPPPLADASTAPQPGLSRAQMAIDLEKLFGASWRARA